MHRLICVALVVAACGGSSQKTTETTMPGNAAAAGPSCAQASGHVIDLLAKAQPDAPPDVVKKIQDALQAHCEKDGWSAESRTCFNSMQTKEQGEKCEDGLTPAQKKSLEAEDVGEGAPPPNGAGPKDSGGGTRGGPHKGGDPCDGGE